MGWQQISETQPKARKEHNCVWCGEVIKKGERYTRITGTYYGDFDSQAWHPECAKASSKYFNAWIATIDDLTEDEAKLMEMGFGFAVSLAAKSGLLKPNAEHDTRQQQNNQKGMPS